MEALEGTLLKATPLSAEKRHAMGVRGRDWVAGDFGWDGIATRMIEVYAWCLRRSDRSDCVSMA